MLMISLYKMHKGNNTVSYLRSEHINVTMVITRTLKYKSFIKIFIQTTIEERWATKILKKNETKKSYLEALEILTPREVEVLKLVEKGKTNNEIGERMC